MSFNYLHLWIVLKQTSLHYSSRGHLMGHRLIGTISSKVMLRIIIFRLIEASCLYSSRVLYLLINNQIIWRHSIISNFDAFIAKLCQLLKKE